MERWIGVAVAALLTTACGAARPQMVGPPSPGSPATPVAGPAAPGAPAADPAIATLNGRLLARASPPTGDADLPVGPGDLIEVSVFEVPELSQLKFRIPMRGAITLPLLGGIPAAGRSPAELESDIRERLTEKYMHAPQVLVFVHEHRSQRVSVTGSVKNAGVFTLTSRIRLADALAMAQGLADDAGEVVYMMRRVPAGSVARAQAGLDPPPRPPVAAAASGAPGAVVEGEDVMAAVDLERLARGQDDLNVELQSGDIVYVPRAGSYYVGGSVERVGSFVLRSRITLDQAILAAGGVKDVADWEDVRVYRTRPDGGREVLTYNLEKFEGGELAPEVEKNDVIVVGQSSTKTFLYGALEYFKRVFGIGISVARPL